MMIRKYLPPFVMWLVFEVIAVTLWFALDNIFFLDCVSGVSLSRKYADRGLLVLSFPRCI